MILRELTGDIYFGEPRGFGIAPTDRAKRSTRCAIASRGRADRARRVQDARLRRRKVCSVDKANVLETMQLWREVVTRSARISRRRADARVRRCGGDDADARAEAVRRDRHRQHLRRHPVRRGGDADRLDRDAAVGVDGGGTKGLYEPVHGTAPDIAGKNLANPIAGSCRWR
jgi:3-isopropylmalate dehydrogenase